MSNSNAVVASAPFLQRSESLTELVVRELERMIFSRELKAGDRINEQLLADRLGVSRGPIREARRALERAGLVVGVANRGLYVRKLDRREVEEMYDLRALITGFVCERLAESATAEQLTRLRAALGEMLPDKTNDDPLRYYEANLRFHNLLMAFCGHTQATRVNDEFVQKMHLVRQQVIAPEIANAEHAAIVEAMEARDPKLAREVGEKHVLGGKRRWLEQSSED